MGKKVTIAAGYVSDEALKFLREHGAVIDSALGLTMIELPEDAEICKPGYQSPQSEYGIQWTDEDGNDPNEWIEVELCFDVNDTTVSLRRHREIPATQAESMIAEELPWEQRERLNDLERLAYCGWED